VIDVDLFEPVTADAAVWPVRPAPKTGELPSSWLSRVALANGLTPRSFFRGLASRHEIAPSGAHPTISGLRPCDPWIDHCAHPRLFADIALRSARDPTEVAAMSLTRAAADAGSALALLAMAAPGVLRPAPSAADGAPRRSDRRPMCLGAVAFCPACLDDGEAWIPVWGRFAWARACLRHGLRLLDRCRRCRRSWSPHALDAVAALDRCAACGHALADGPRVPARREDLWLQWALTRRLPNLIRSISAAPATNTTARLTTVAELAAGVNAKLAAAAPPSIFRYAGRRSTGWRP
jgi:hypothetical protein